MLSEATSSNMLRIFFIMMLPRLFWIFWEWKAFERGNGTLITLVPKVHNPAGTNDLGPIACCKLIYKVITNVLCNRLKAVLPYLVDLSQSAVANRSIIHNIMTSKDVVRCYQRKGEITKVHYEDWFEKSLWHYELEFLNNIYWWLWGSLGALWIELWLVWLQLASPLLSMANVMHVSKVIGD